MNLHEHYDKLSTEEKNWVDNMVWHIRNTAKHDSIKLVNDDRAEVFVDAFAKYLLESKTY